MKMYSTRMRAALASLAAVSVLPGVGRADSMIFVKDPVVDLGTVKQGVDVKHVFTIENRGDSDLEIKSMKASCSCTVPGGLAQRIVPPGGKVDLPVEFRSKGRSGTIPSRVTLTTNDPKDPELVLRLRVTVEAVAIINPKAIFFSSGKRGEVLPKAIEIMPGKKNAKLEILELTCENSGIEIEIQERESAVQSKIGAIVQVRLGEDIPFGRVVTELKGRVRVGDEAKDIKIPVNGTVVGDIRVLPPFVARTNPVGRDVDVGMITVKADQDALVKVEAAKARSPHFVTEIVELESDKMYRVKVQMTDDAPGGPMATTVDIYTSSSDLPVASIPVFVNAEEVVRVSPTWVYLDAGDPAKARRTITLRAEEGQTLKVTKITCGDPAISANVLAGEKESHVVRVEVALGKDAADGAHNALLKIETNVPGAGELTIPIRAVAGPIKQAAAP